MYLMHYGIKRRSGRYPWGSGKDPAQHSRDFLDQVDNLKRSGMSESDIAKFLGLESSTQLRAKKTIAKNARKAADITFAQRLKEKGMSNVAIADRMNLNESSVRALLAPTAKMKSDSYEATANIIKEAIKENKYVDVGAGTNNQLGISSTKLSTSVSMLKEEGYKLQYVKVKQLGTGEYTTIKVLTAPDTTYSDLYSNKDKIKPISGYSEDGGFTYSKIETPRSVSSKRIDVKYGPDGGAEKDGLIELRRNVNDISLGASNYAQVRIAIDKTHYIKGMAVYSDNLPDGVDIRFNTNKSNTGNKKDAFKELKDSKDNPFGAIVRQRHYLDKDGNKKLSAINIVNEEGDWDKWSKSLSSQMLSKQSPELAKKQLELAYSKKLSEYEKITSLTNPMIKKKLLETFSDDCDSSAVHLKAAGLPRQKTQVILPVSSLKSTEVYAPNFRDGENVVLIRYPHGGIFEIPELRVNNKNREAKNTLGNAKDAIGINHKVAAKLSGADFDGDTVLVIPNNNKEIKTSKSLKELKDFDPKVAYPSYPGMKIISERNKQKQMGLVSNLITDMTIKGAESSEIARAVKHSMVVIDAEKHKLNYKQSALDQNISQLKIKYQGRANAGASTLISKASSQERVNKRRAARKIEGGPINKHTGEKQYVNTGEHYIDKSGKLVYKTFKSTKMAEVKDAYKLSSGSYIENIYASHANSLKALANKARKEMINTKDLVYSPSANKMFSKEVSSLKAKLNVAFKNAPIERLAQTLANAEISQLKSANPNMTGEEIKKMKSIALDKARTKTGAKKARILFTPEEWNAIQQGAISKTMLNNILANADLDKVKELATPIQTSNLSPSKIAKARALAMRGFTQAEIADSLGVSVSKLNKEVFNG